MARRWHFTLEQRRQIERLLKEGFTFSKIADTLGIKVGTVFSEVRRNCPAPTNPRDYSAEAAQDRASTVRRGGKTTYIALTPAHKEQQRRIVFEEMDKGTPIMVIRSMAKIGYQSLLKIVKEYRNTRGQLEPIHLLENRFQALEENVKLIIDLLRNQNGNK